MARLQYLFLDYSRPVFLQKTSGVHLSVFPSLYFSLFMKIINNMSSSYRFFNYLGGKEGQLAIFSLMMAIQFILNKGNGIKKLYG